MTYRALALKGFLGWLVIFIIVLAGHEYDLAFMINIPLLIVWPLWLFHTLYRWLELGLKRRDKTIALNSCYGIIMGVGLGVTSGFLLFFFGGMFLGLIFGFTFGLACGCISYYRKQVTDPSDLNLTI